MRIRSFATVGASAAMALGVAACGGDTSTSNGGGGGAEISGSLSGAGASSQSAAQTAWTAGFQEKNPSANIAYDPSGSGAGREQFVAGGTDFGGSDAAFEGEELAGAKKRCGQLVEIPAYISPIAAVYNLPGVKDLQLSAEALAGMMTGDITTWNDPKIAADNPGVKLPATRVTPVHRSDDSGTTENFTEYLNAVAPDVWTEDPDGEWPLKGGEAADGTSGMVEAVGAGEGTIGYADASQAGDLGVAKIKVGDTYVAPSPEGAAKLVEESKRSSSAGKYTFTYDLKRDTTDPTTYPVTLVSYGFACQRYDDAAKAKAVKAYFAYQISAEGQQKAASTAGNAPISDTLRKQLQGAVDAIGAGAGAAQ